MDECHTKEIEKYLLQCVDNFMKASRIFEDIYFNGIESTSLMVRSFGAHKRALPNCFILGVIKGGTSSLAHYLSFHPNYIPAFTKEINLLHDLPNNRKYQDGSLLLSSSYGKYDRHDDSAYRKFFPFQNDIRRLEDETGLPVYTGDHTPFNFYCDTALDRIKEICPKPKLIVLLRNPIDRAYSHHSMNALRFSEQRSFTESIAEELSGKTGGIKHDYLFGSTYYPRMKQIFNLFDRKTVMVIKSEDFFEEPLGTLNNVFQFLELPNPTIKQDLPLILKGSYESALPAETRNQLEKYFKPLNEPLYDLLGRDFKW